MGKLVLVTAMRHFAFAPFRQLLPLCGAVVHHGGVGMTAAALEAGRPCTAPAAGDEEEPLVRGELREVRRENYASVRSSRPEPMTSNIATAATNKKVKMNAPPLTKQTFVNHSVTTSWAFGDIPLF